MKKSLVTWVIPMIKWIYTGWMSLLLLLTPPLPAVQKKHPLSGQEQNRQHLFETMETWTGVPWTYLSAIDQFERNTRIGKQKRAETGAVGIHIPSHLWAGVFNPDPDDQNPLSIQFFHGMGRDGNGDGKANPKDDMDILYSLSLYLTQKGVDEVAIREQLWHYYRHPTSVDVITHIAQIFKKNQTLSLHEQSFPIPIQYNYTYHNTWGHRRGWGGVRIHEGTDIFAGYGTPVLSTCHGYVELIGWNRFGGWRIGLRDTQGRYHYFAHLSRFRKGLKKGDIVKPGEVIGSVGSSGYGPPGTAGKFPPHLHYGLYRFNGQSTYSFDPYPTLKKWEREAFRKRKELRKKRKAAHQPSLKWVD
jgi:hypothetical protein